MAVSSMFPPAMREAPTTGQMPSREQVKASIPAGTTEHDAAPGAMAPRAMEEKALHGTAEGMPRKAMKRSGPAGALGFKPRMVSAEGAQIAVAAAPGGVDGWG